MQDGLRVHRFPIEMHDPVRHGEIYRSILEAAGKVAPETEKGYLQYSIHSAALVTDLRPGAMNLMRLSPVRTCSD